MILSKQSSHNSIAMIRQYMQESNHHVAIRWGYTGGQPYGMTYNSADAIHLSSDKERCRDYLHSCGLAVPIDQGYPLIGRTPRHHAGHGFYICRNERQKRRAQAHGATYFSTYYPKTKEYRAHVAHGKILLLQQKVSERPSSRVRWNARFGYTFHVIPWDEYIKPVCLLAIKAVDALQLDFGAVDVLSEPTSTSFPPAVICEVNTAPSVDGYTAERYAEYFDFLYRNTVDAKIPHFEIDPDRKPRHLALKHWQLEG